MSEIFLQSQKDRRFRVDAGILTRFSVERTLMVAELYLKLFHPDDFPAVVFVNFLSDTGWQRQEMWSGVRGLVVPAPHTLLEEAPPDVSYSDSIAKLYALLLTLREPQQRQKFFASRVF